MGDKHAEQTRAEAMASALQVVAAAARKIADGPSIKELQEMTAHIGEVVPTGAAAAPKTTAVAYTEGAPLLWDCGKLCAGSCIKAPLCCPRCGSTRRTMQNPAPPVTAQAKKKDCGTCVGTAAGILPALKVGDWTRVDQDGVRRVGMISVINPKEMGVAVDVYFDPKYDKPEMRHVAVRHWCSMVGALIRKVSDGDFAEGMMVRGKHTGRLGFVRAVCDGAATVTFFRWGDKLVQESGFEDIVRLSSITPGWGDHCPSRAYTRRLKYGAKPIEVGDLAVTLFPGEWLSGVVGKVAAVNGGSCELKTSEHRNGLSVTGLIGAPLNQVSRMFYKSADEVALGDQIVLLGDSFPTLGGSIAFITGKTKLMDGSLDFRVRLGSEKFGARYGSFVVVEG